MLRALGAFFVVFSLLSLVVSLEGLGRLFGMCALALFGVDLLLPYFIIKSARPSRMTREPLL
jgi:hypothetical protein